MGIYNKNIRNNNGISYSKEVDGPSDWINIESETYFKDLSDSLIYYKNSNDIVISIFEEAGITSADNGLNISTSDDIELGGTLNKDTDINGNNKTLNLGTLTDALNGININSITSTRTHTFPGFDSITSEYTPGNLTINSVSLSGDQTHQNTTTPLQYRRQISDTSTNITSYIDLQDQLTFSSENTSTSQDSSLLFATNQTSLSHSSGSGTSNVFTQTDLQTSLYYSGNTQNGIIITGDTINLYGPETNIDLNISGSIFTDNRVSGSTKGLEYGDDYHLGFTDRTLVDKAYVDDSIVNNITSSAGSGLTFNTTTNKIDLGGVLDFNDPGNPSNNIYFIPSTGANIVRWGADYLGNLPVNEYGVSDYIVRFDYVAQQGEHKIFGNSGHTGVHIGYYEGQTSNTRIRQYKDVSQITIQNTPGVNSSYTFGESDGPQYWRRDIWQSHDSNEKSKAEQSYSMHSWEVSDSDSVNPATQRTSAWVVRRADIGGSVRSADGSSMGIFMLRSDSINFMDGTNSGIMAAPDYVFVGKFSGSGLEIGSNAHSSGVRFVDGTNDKKGIKYAGFGETDIDSAAGANYTTLVNTSLVPKKYVDDVILDVNTIYNADDSLTGNRIVDLGGYNLTFQKLSSTDEYTKIYRNGGLEVRGSGFDTGNDVFKVKYRVSGNDLLSVGQNGGVTIDSSISMGQFNATWNYGQRFSDGYISFSNGANWNDNEQIRFDLRNNTNPTLTFNRNAQGTAGSRFIVRNSTLYETNYGTSKEQISLQGNTLIKGDSGLERTPYNFKIVNSSGDNTFVSNDDKSIEVYGRTKLLSKEHGILLNRVDSSEMNAISAEPNEVVYNTELNALYRWDNNLTTWVALASGYGLISVTDSSGRPTFYADLPSAFNSSSSDSVINLHSNITVTSQCTMPGSTNATLTINGNGHTITHTSDIGSEFYLVYTGSGNNKILYLNDVKIVSNGTATGSSTAAIFAPQSGSGSMSIKANSGTFVSSINNPCAYIVPITGGNWTSTNSYVNFGSTTKDATITVKSGRGSFINCDITIVSGGQIGTLGDLIDCTITGDATVDIMILVKIINKVHGCTINCTSGGYSALWVDGGSVWTNANPTPIKDTKVYYSGTHPYAVSAQYIASIKDVYIYSENTTCLYAQNTTQTGGYNLENVVLETNSTTRPAFYRLDSGSFRMKNVSATNWNSTNTEEAFDIRVSGSNELYMEDCTANINNPVVDNIKLNNSSITTGGAYIYGLKMSKIGTGLNMNTVPLLNINTIDAYGNLKIG